jgi:hypothetical protein
MPIRRVRFRSARRSRPPVDDNRSQPDVAPPLPTSQRGYTTRRLRAGRWRVRDKFLALPKRRPDLNRRRVVAVEKPQLGGRSLRLDPGEHLAGHFAAFRKLVARRRRRFVLDYWPPLVSGYHRCLVGARLCNRQFDQAHVVDARHWAASAVATLDEDANAVTPDNRSLPGLGRACVPERDFGTKLRRRPRRHPRHGDGAGRQAYDQGPPDNNPMPHAAQSKSGRQHPGDHSAPIQL